ncbi:hypothetical protein ABE237_25485 [Brevibacillus formosus]|uniref:hypothetical protein n=1 Tax=Brevibacillus formosus TaxID=54913 RepID=UPI0018CF884F|nr:hypothetical protein [Brevibacillus formosus]
MIFNWPKGRYYGDELCGVHYTEDGKMHYYFMGQLEQPRKGSEEECRDSHASITVSGATSSANYTPRS